MTKNETLLNAEKVQKEHGINHKNLFHKENLWIADFGASAHTTFLKLDEDGEEKEMKTVVSVGNGEKVKFFSKGNKTLWSEKGEVKLTNVIHSYSFDYSLLSIPYLKSKGILWKNGLNGEHCLFDCKSGKVVLKETKKYGLYVFDLTKNQEMVLFGSDTEIWHLKLDHSNIRRVVDMSKKGVLVDMPTNLKIAEIQDVCRSCKEGKMKSMAFNRKDKKVVKSKGKLEVLHVEYVNIKNEKLTLKMRNCP